MNTRKWLTCVITLALIVLGACTEITQIVTVDQHGGNGNGTGNGTGTGTSCGTVLPVVAVSPKTGSGNAGATLQLAANVSCGSTAGTWASTDPTRGTVNSTGLVTFGASAGTFSICFVLSDNTMISDCARLTSNGAPAAGQSVTGVTTTTPNITFSTCSAWQDQRYKYAVATTGNNTPAGVQFTLLTNHALTSITTDGMVALKSPAVAGTDTIKIASTFDATKFVLVTYTVTVTNTACQYDLPQGPYVLGSGASCTNNTITLTSPVAGTWTSGNTSLATVTSAGVATSVPNVFGSVTFTFTPTNGGTAKTVTLQVSNTTCVPAVTTTVTVSPKTLNLFIGQTANLNATVTVSSGSAPTINWTKSSSCVSVSATTGATTSVTANSACTTYIVTSANGVRDSAQVVVTSGVSSIDYAPPGGTLAVNATQTLTATCTLNSGMTACTPYWYSTDPSRVTVVGAPSTIVIGGFPYPAGNTALIKGIFKGTADICVQAALQDSSIKKCYTWTVP